MEYMSSALPTRAASASEAAEGDTLSLIPPGGRQRKASREGVSAIVHMRDAIVHDKPPPQRHMYRLFAATAMLFLLLGAFLGMALESYLDASGGGLKKWLLEGDGVCRDGLFIPGPQKNHLMMLVFTALLLWSFVGVAIVADIFMVGIEVITSEEKETTVMVNGEEKRVYVSVWNSTVANLTLMALGSSAPEILLSCIEVVTGNFYAGELGPSTIVGSAAFNLLVISAVCVAAIPEGEGKLIADQGVFYITGSFSVLAYLWLLVILMVTSPNIIDIWEGALTFLFFPLLVGLAYFADCGGLSRLFGSKSEHRPSQSIVGVDKGPKGMSKDEVGRLLANANSGADGYVLSEQSKAAAKEAVTSQMSTGTHSRAFYRVSATRSATGGKDMVAQEAKIKAKVRSAPADAEAPHRDAAGRRGAKMLQVDEAKPAIQFVHTGVSVNETETYLDLQLHVTGGAHADTVSVHFETVSGTATAGLDFEATSGRVEFHRGQTQQTIRIPIMEDDEVEGNEHFEVVISEPSRGARIGPASSCEVTIQDNDSHGVLAFEQETVAAKESDRLAVVTVVRKDGLAGRVTCKFITKDGTAMAGADYTAQEGELVFDKGVTKRQIQIEVTDDGTYEKEEQFRIELTDVDGGASFAHGASKETCVVRILSDDVRKELIDSVAASLDLNVDSIRLAASSWREQAVMAVKFEGESFLSSAGFFYLLALPWKTICAGIPPPRLAHGWVCFGVTLVIIGILTAFIGDLAAHVGCTMGLKSSVTAITFVALGTSLPDTFASKAAAVNEPSADNSIGNITGSNSVNVFLGLGLPWMIAAIYWKVYADDPELAAAWHAKYAGEAWHSPDMAIGFAVPAGDLGYSVAVFTVCALVCLGTLILRRAVLGFELGGPETPKKATAAFFVFLWFVYIALSASAA